MTMTSSAFDLSQFGSRVTSLIDPENRIINGAFDFWQRGTSFTASAYGADRWANANNGGTVTMSRQAFALGDTLGNNSPTYFLRQAVSGQSASGHLAVVQQRVEGVRSYAGQTITVLGWARRSSGSGNMGVNIDQYFGSGGSPSSEVNVAGQTVTLTASYAAFAVTFAVPSISGKTLGTNGNDALVLNFWTSAGSDNNARSNSLGLQTIGVDLWGIHIKLGSQTVDAVDYYRQPELGPELLRCQRYYWRGSIYSGYRYAQNIPVGPKQWPVYFSLPVKMRVWPAGAATFTNIDAARNGGLQTLTDTHGMLSMTSNYSGEYASCAWDVTADAEL